MLDLCSYVKKTLKRNFANQKQGSKYGCRKKIHTSKFHGICMMKKFHQNTSNFAIFKKKKKIQMFFFISNKLANSLTFFRHFSLIQSFMDQLPLMRICEVWILVIVLAPSYFSCAFEIICNQLPPHACHAIPALYSCQSIFLGLSKSMVGGLCNWHHKGNLEKTKMKSRFRSFRRATHALNSMENLF